MEDLLYYSNPAELIKTNEKFREICITWGSTQIFNRY